MDPRRTVAQLYNRIIVVLKQMLGLPKTLMEFSNVSTSEYKVPKNKDFITEYLELKKQKVSFPVSLKHYVVPNVLRYSGLSSF